MALNSKFPQNPKRFARTSETKLYSEAAPEFDICFKNRYACYCARRKPASQVCLCFFFDSTAQLVSVSPIRWICVKSLNGSNPSRVNFMFTTRSVGFFSWIYCIVFPSVCSYTRFLAIQGVSKKAQPYSPAHTRAFCLAKCHSWQRLPKFHHTLQGV